LSKGDALRVLALAFVAIALGQSDSRLTGTWTADYHGTTYVRVALADGTAGPQGSMSIGQSIHVDKEGNVDSATPASTTLSRMLDIRWNGSVLSFSIKADDDVDRFELRLINTNTAELTPIVPEEQQRELAADGIPLPKPFRLTKTR
jgi:hypothetical protein